MSKLIWNLNEMFVIKWIIEIYVFLPLEVICKLIIAFFLRSVGLKKNGGKWVFKCPLTEAKLSYTVLKLIFLAKMNENWVRDCWSENTSNDTFHFSVNVIELQFQPTCFLACYFFVLKNFPNSFKNKPFKSQSKHC